ncbi:dephospho-CoA kinase [candidate division WOR-3 bacterium JGI_Cruoil_03_51_56]|uniref:Dephospho-CoA kinase n=1 Tax=candidate division WOR-3 bacterium JGI_Cruoil_03_51_56 TaxID=1973747 RepID=A0A235BVQ2_UNCW3|nr:MAG: dephospho-CoA kinase [candidate division WOR-3 bacterium JGI_Cruoil_03_51_56]
MFDRKLSQRRLLVGIGGNIGAGKTTVTNELKRYGAKIIDADKIGWALLRRNSPHYKKLVEVFGKRILNKNGQIDHKALAERAFANKTSLKKLNRIMHPPIIKRIKKEITKNQKGLVILDAALLFTLGLNKEMDVAILVTAPERLKVKRLIESGMTKEAAKARLKLQEPDSKVWRKAGFVLENKGSLAELRRKSRALWNFFYSSRFQNLKTGS